MDKLKNLLKSDTPTDKEPTESSNRLAGQGSHFPGKDETTSSGLGSTVTGTSTQSRGPTDVSAAPTSSAAVALSGGPERGGTDHVNTTSAPSGTGAAVGQTSTYTTTHLPKGDPTSSIADPSSADPLTYQKPEAGAARTAASLAFSQAEERKKTELPGHENPYRTTQLDPRVDGLSKDSAPVDTSTTKSGHDSSLGTTAASGAGAGLAAAGAATALAGHRGHDDTTTSSGLTGSTEHAHAPAPSSLTTTADPANRSAEYQSSTGDRGLGTSTTSATTDNADDPNRQSMVGRALGAVGLGGLFGAGAASAADSSAVTDSHQPTSTTGIETYNTPTRQGAPTTHHRKESIPTTAYPSGTFDSPRAIHPPLGGVGSPVIHGDQSGPTGQDVRGTDRDESHTGRNVATGVAAGGAAAAGVAALGAHEYNQRGSATTTGTSGVDTLAHRDANTLGSSSANQPSTGMSTFHDATTIGGDSTTTGVSSSLPVVGGTGTTSRTTDDTTTTGLGSTGTTTRTTEHPTTATTTTDVGKEKDHTARDAAIGTGAGVAAAGAGAYGAHEYSKKEAEKAEKEAAKEERYHQKEVEKEEKKHQKEAEKEEKKHQKEAEKEEKKLEKQQHKEHEAEVAALKERRQEEKEQARLQKQREEQAEDRKIREERERLAAAAGIGGAAGATAAYGEKEKEKEKEKKPNIFKRIFKRRKNKDTGEDEKYSSDDDPSKGSSGPRKSLTSGTSAKTQEERYDSIPSGQKEIAGTYGTKLTGHPEDHPYHDNTERRRSSTTKERRRSSLVASQIGADGKTQEEVFDSIPSDQKERVGAYGARLAGHPEDHPYHDNSERRASVTKERRRSSGTGAAGVAGVAAAAGAGGALGAGTGTSTTGTTGITKNTDTTGVAGSSYGTTAYERASGGAQKPSYNPFHKGDSSTLEKDAITGLPYDPSKDPEAARRLSSLTHGERIGTYDKKDAALAASTGTAGATALDSTAHTGTSQTHSGTTAPTTLDSTGTRSMQPTEAVTGTPSTTTGTYDKQTAPATVGSTGTHTQQPAGAVTGVPTPHSTGTHDSSTTHGTTTGTDTGVHVPDFTMGEITDTRR